MVAVAIFVAPTLSMLSKLVEGISVASIQNLQ